MSSAFWAAAYRGAERFVRDDARSLLWGFEVPRLPSMPSGSGTDNQEAYVTWLLFHRARFPRFADYQQENGL